MLAQKTSVFSIEINGELQFSLIKGIKHARIVDCTLHFILDKTNQEKYGLPVQRKIPHYYIVCQLLPLEDASCTPQYLKLYLYLVTTPKTQHHIFPIMSLLRDRKIRGPNMYSSSKKLKPVVLEKCHKLS